MSVTPLPTLDRTDPNFRTDVDTFFGTELPTFSVEVEALRVEVLAREANAIAQASTATTQAGIATTQAGISTAQAVISTAQAGISTTQAGLAAASAASAVNAPGTSATSTTSLTIGTGAKSLTIQTGKLFTVGQTIVIARTSVPSTQMTGVITSHDSGTGAIAATVATGATSGSGTYTDWTISLSGIQGIQGATAAMARDVRTSDIALTASDIGKLIDITTGTIQTLASAVSIGAAWDLTIKNSTANTITITPTVADLINGASSYLLESGHTLSLQCNGVTFTSASDSVRMSRLHVLSAAAATKNAVTTMLPLFDSSHLIPIADGADRMMYTGSLFLTGPIRVGSPQIYATSPDGKTFTTRYLDIGINFNLARNNGANVIIVTGPAAGRSSNSGISFTYGASLGRTPTFAAYATSDTYLAGDAELCQVSTNNAVSFTADQTIPASASNVFAVGTTFVSYNIASGTYYTSTTGLTGSWTARTLPDAITASKIWEDGAGGLVLVSTTTSKNLWHTVDGIAWTDLGFSQDSLKYGGLSDATNNTAAFVCPVRINGNWVLFNGSTAGAGGAMVKYAGNTWVPMFVNIGGIANTNPSKMLVATNGAGVTVIRDASANDKVRLINTASTKCVGNFI